MTAHAGHGAPHPTVGDAVVEVVDERDPLTRAALRLIEEMFPPYDRQSLDELLSEMAEQRYGLLAADRFHVLTTLAEDGRPMGTVAGLYMAGVNAGFVTYLAVRPEYRGRQLARTLRTRLLEDFRADARREEWDDLAWVVGEVRSDNRWLRRLVRHRGAIPFDLTYYHPGMTPGATDVEYTLYRQPVGDRRRELPATLVRQLLYAIYRRAYRVRYPLVRPGFLAMLRELEGREVVGAHPNTDVWAAEG